MRRQRVFLDANILVSVRLRDIFLGFAEQRCVDVYWSEAVLAETRRALERRIGLAPEAADRLIDALVGAFPLSTVDWDPKAAEGLSLPDRDDRHVLAAAIAAECDLLITDNIKDFPDDAIPKESGLAVVDANEGIQLLAGDYQGSVPALLLSIVDRYKNPPMTQEQIIDGIRQVAPMGGVGLGAAVGREADLLTIHSAIDAMRHGSPQDVIVRVLDLLRTDEDALLQDLVSVDFQQVASIDNVPVETQLRRLLGEVLDEPAADWGVGSQSRPISPNESLVKLIRTVELSEVVTEPTGVYGYMCWLVHEDGAWKVDRIGGGDPAVLEARAAPL